MMNNRVNVLTVKEYNEWKELLTEMGYKYQIENKSDYSGFEVEIRWKED